MDYDMLIGIGCDTLWDTVAVGDSEAVDIL
jgi:hypothetical protein